MGSTNSATRSRPHHVVIVGQNPETLDGLEAYLRRAGVITIGTRYLDKIGSSIVADSTVVVLFPDDFDPDAICATLTDLRSQRPKVLTVLVTKEPRRFRCLPVDDSVAGPLVVPKPVWGWTILDAIRARLDLERAQVEGSR